MLGKSPDGLGWGVSDFRKLNVWRKAHALALNVHQVAKRIRGSDYAALRSQMMRASMSVPTNIVEGNGQKSRREFARFVGIALNSTSELEYHLLAGRDLAVISEADFRSLSDQATEVRKMLCGLQRTLLSTADKPAKEGSTAVT